MNQQEWAKEILPGIYSIGNDASDTGGHQAILVEQTNGYEDNGVNSFLIFTECHPFVLYGSGHGSWIGNYYELTTEDRERVMNRKEGSYELSRWLKEKYPDSTKFQNIEDSGMVNGTYEKHSVRGKYYG